MKDSPIYIVKVTDPNIDNKIVLYKIESYGVNRNLICTAHRRYKEFEKLFKDICKVYKSHVIPKLPKKQVLGRFSKEFIESRRKGLEDFLAGLVSHPIICESPDLITFLSENTCERKYSDDELDSQNMSLSNKSLVDSEDKSTDASNLSHLIENDHTDISYVLRQFQNAKQSAVQLLEEYEESYGSYHQKTLSAICNLALMHLSFYEDISLKFSANDLTLYNISLEDFQNEAREYFLQALDRKELTVGPDDISTLRIVSHIASILNAQGDHATALELYRRVKKGYELALEPDNIDLLQLYINYASLQKSLGNLEEAQTLFEIGLSGILNSLGLEHPLTLSALTNFAELFVEKGEYDEALALYDQVRNEQERSLGSDHISTLITLANIAMVYQLQGQLNEAVLYFQTAFDGFSRNLGPNHKYTELAKDSLDALQQSALATATATATATDSTTATNTLDGSLENAIETIPNVENQMSEPLTNAKEEKEKKEDQNYDKYIKMLKFGIPIEAIKQKYIQETGNNPEGLVKKLDNYILAQNQQAPDPAASDKQEQEPSPSNIEMIALSEHPIFSKYFKMLKFGLSKEVVAMKMKLEGHTSELLDKDPTEMIPLNYKKPEAQKIAVQDHPKLSKYFKMLKIGLPLETIKHKMEMEGIEPSYIEKCPTDLVEADLDPILGSKLVKTKALPDFRKKRIHWKVIDASKIKETLWGELGEEDDIFLDEAEFNQLFVQRLSNDKKKTLLSQKETRKQRVNLIDMKRGQNAGIQLARVKLSFEEVKKKIFYLDDNDLSQNQLKSLEEYLPTKEEKVLVDAYQGDYADLGRAEQYMRTMTDFSSAGNRIQCMLFKLQFDQRISEIKNMISKIENACDDVKLSLRFKKLLKTILKVGNQLNDGADNVGFTVDSLLKLQSAKAFDNKTSILQYIITLLYRNDTSVLYFTEDLSRVADAARISMESILNERSLITNQFKKSKVIFTSILTQLSEEESKITGVELIDHGDQPLNCPGLGAMNICLENAEKICGELDISIDVMSTKLSNLLNYFGEEKGMHSHVFFSTLHKFLLEFISTREKVEILMKSEERKGFAPSRRNSNPMNNTDIENISSIIDSHENPTLDYSIHKSNSTGESSENDSTESPQNSAIVNNVDIKKQRRASAFV